MKDDVVLSKVRNVLYSREGRACNEDIDEKGNMNCVLKWMQNTYVNKAQCQKGLISSQIQQFSIEMQLITLSVCSFPQMHYTQPAL